MENIQTRNDSYVVHPIIKRKSEVFLQKRKHEGKKEEIFQYFDRLLKLSHDVRLFLLRGFVTKSILSLVKDMMKLKNEKEEQRKKR